MGLIDIKGAPRVTFTGDKFQKNGDAVREVKDVYPMQQIPKAASDFDMGFKEAFANAGNVYPASIFMKSLVNIERSSQLTMTNVNFEYNWLLENNCSPMRAQILTLNDFAGLLKISGITVNQHTGFGNYYNTHNS